MGKEINAILGAQTTLIWTYGTALWHRTSYYTSTSMTKEMLKHLNISSVIVCHVRELFLSCLILDIVGANLHAV